MDFDKGEEKHFASGVRYLEEVKYFVVVVVQELYVLPFPYPFFQVVKNQEELKVGPVYFLFLVNYLDSQSPLQLSVERLFVDQNCLRLEEPYSLYLLMESIGFE